MNSSSPNTKRSVQIYPSRHSLSTLDAWWHLVILKLIFFFAFIELSSYFINYNYILSTAYLMKLYTILEHVI